MTRWRRADSIAWVGDADRFVVVDVAAPDPRGAYVLEGTAAWLWDQLADPVSLAGLASAVTGDVAAVEDDLAGALVEWESLGLIHAVPVASDENPTDGRRPVALD